MTSYIHTIHHYEDEPALLRWIPGVLFNRFWSRFPSWIRNDGNYQEDVGLTSFELHVNGDTHLVEYRLYNGEAEFKNMFKPGQSDVALIDVMDNGRPLGLQVYTEVVKTLHAEAVYLLTSFPDKVNLNVPSGHILPKPIDVTELAELLIDRLAIGRIG